MTLYKESKIQFKENPGKNFNPMFKPDLTPKQMLRLGVFGGAYFILVPGLKPKFIPKSWWKGVKFSPDGKKHDELNFFKEGASQSLAVWRKKGWIYKEDPHGWFEWYTKYYLGRRIPKEDERQIKRWRAIARHISQVTKNCRAGDLSCRPKQRQALLHWAYDPRKI